MKSSKIPKYMSVLQIDRYTKELKNVVKSLRVVQKPVPKPGVGEVLVKIEAASCNPSDLIFMTGKYNIIKELPAVPGFEACGRVVQAGPGLIPRMRLGKYVACAGQGPFDGTWAEYFVVDAKACLPVRTAIKPDQAASLIVNPMTAIGLLDRVKKRKSRAFIQTAAASQLGRMINNLARAEKLDVINIVRKDAQVRLLQNAGAQYVLNSTKPDFLENLRKIANEMGATTAIDALSGTMPGILLAAMPDHSEAIVYGTLEANTIDALRSRLLSFNQKQISGFNLKSWIEQKGILATLANFKRVQKYSIAGLIHTEIRESVSLKKAPAAIKRYINDMTGGKIVIVPGKDQY